MVGAINSSKISALLLEPADVRSDWGMLWAGRYRTHDVPSGPEPLRAGVGDHFVRLMVSRRWSVSTVVHARCCAFSTLTLSGASANGGAVIHARDVLAETAEYR